MSKEPVDAETYIARKRVGILLFFLGLGLVLLIGSRLYNQMELWSSTQTVKRHQIVNTKSHGQRMTIHYKFQVLGKTYHGSDVVWYDHWEVAEGSWDFHIKYLPQNPRYNCFNASKTTGNVLVSIIILITGMAVMTAGIVMVRLRNEKVDTMQQVHGETAE